MGWFVQAPTFAPAKLNDENVMSVPMNARRWLLAQRCISVRRRLGANETADFHADIADLQGNEFDAIEYQGSSLVNETIEAIL